MISNFDDEANGFSWSAPRPSWYPRRFHFRQYKSTIPSRHGVHEAYFSRNAERNMFPQNMLAFSIDDFLDSDYKEALSGCSESLCANVTFPHFIFV